MSGVTPVLLTYNEAPNVARTLESLRWATRVVVVDSGSTDETLEIAGRYGNVEVYHRKFDSHGAQWEYAVRETGVATEYVLALDADMCVTGGFVEEMEAFAGAGFDAGLVRFRMVIDGRDLGGGLYPPQLRLFRPGAVRIRQRGHTQVFEGSGRVYRFREAIRHDDRKGWGRWVSAQLKYAELEAERIESGEGHGLKDRLRRAGLMPMVAGVIAYGLAGGPMRGGAALRYALERATFESLLSLRLREKGRREAEK
jgi:glycosyltransferase involved in cell wall biosynthesis